MPAKEQRDKLSINDKMVIVSLKEIYKTRVINSSQSPAWISTRDIAEHCNINIYRARYSLLKLEARGIVAKQTNKSKNHSWRPVQDHFLL